jgi:hypothetical protein
MKYFNCIVSVAILTVFLTGCSSSKKGLAISDEERRMDLLLDFSMAVNKGEFALAVSYLSDEDKASLVGVTGEISLEVQNKLKDVRLQKLRNNPFVRLSNGKISGIFETKGSLNRSNSVQNLVNNFEEPEIAQESIPEAEKDSAQLAQEEEKRIELIEQFFNVIKLNQWSKAQDMLDERELSILLDDKGQIRPSAKDRFLAIPQNDRSLLQLYGGKLTGFLALLPPE